MPFNPNRSVDASFRRFGIAGVIDPDGAATGAQFIPEKGEELGTYGELTIDNAGTLFQVRASEWGDRGKGAVFEVAGVRRKVQRKPARRDVRGIVLVLDSIEIASP